MPFSVFELFKIGVGPSSSHTMGPMTAGCRFNEELSKQDLLFSVERIRIRLFSSLALTGKGHATDTAAITGLMSIRPEEADPDTTAQMVAEVKQTKRLRLDEEHDIFFDEDRDIDWCGDEQLDFHPNGIQFIAYNDANAVLLDRIYYSIGGGFVLDDVTAESITESPATNTNVLAYTTASELLALGRKHGISIAEIALAHEDTKRPRAETLKEIERICTAMDACINRGLSGHGTLPGGLNVKRRAPLLLEKLNSRSAQDTVDTFSLMDWVNLWAIAVNEENAAGGKVVTAPTNGAAGIIPAVMRYYNYAYGSTEETRANFLLTASAIGALFKRNASISAAEVGCQGEVGVACSMAAAGLTAVLGGSNLQIENAAEIGMEHNLGLTCDPIGGLVQIPCIERNALGAVKAISAARLALSGDGEHHVSLDAVIDTMKRTGRDMRQDYKETSKGGLATYIPAC